MGMKIDCMGMAKNEILKYISGRL